MRCSERYHFEIGDKRFVLQFMPLIYQHEYTDEQLDRLEEKAAFDVSFYLEDENAEDNGERVASFGIMGTGDAFKVLGAVAHGIMKWEQETHPDYLCWYAMEPNRARLYARMVQYFEQRSGLRRLAADPFTGAPCAPTTFWVGR